MIKKIIFLVMFFCVFVVIADDEGCKRKIKVLIVDGQNNHNVWPKSTIMMKQYLEDTGLFKVHIARTQYLNKSIKFKEWLPLAKKVPNGVEGKPRKDPDFKPKFSKYDVVISNFGWRAAAWPEETKANFETYIKNGGGFVSVHAADNSFPKWEAYNKMIAIGGWGGRTEKNGPYLYVDENDETKRDYSVGKGGDHGKKSAFLITTYNNEHPITKGIPKTWMHAPDECYAYLRGPAENVTILATAVSTKKDPELQQKEPVLMAINYGKGRVFHTTLGHDSKSFECVGFITLLTRGIEWAATNNVTLTELPKDFPSANEVSVRDFIYKK